VAGELISSPAFSIADSNYDGDATCGNGCEYEKDQSREIFVGEHAPRLSGSAKVAGARPAVPPTRRVNMTRGGAAQETKRRRFEETAGAAGFDTHSRILNTMGWDDWNDGGAFSSEDIDEEEP